MASMDDDHEHEDEDERERDHGNTLDWTELGRIAFVAAAAAAVWFRIWEPFARVSVLGVVGTLGGGWPIFHQAWDNVRQRRMTMELSMTIALVAALVIGEFFTALVITAFVLAAEVLEGLTVGRGRRAIRDLLDFLPATATVRRTAGSIRIPLGQVRIGDVVLVAPGESIAVDGCVRSGHSYVDQATITGESTPVEKGPGASVYAGTINQSGALEIAADRLGRDTSFGKIVEAVEHAERSRAPVQKTADRYAGYLVSFALACAARTGAIIKGGRYLEALWQVDTVAFDKTGTVTIGRPEILEIRPAGGVTGRAVLEAAAIAERRSEHPLAAAIVRAADAGRLPPVEPETFEYIPGRGIVAQTNGEQILIGNRVFVESHGILPGPLTGSDVPQAVSEVFVARDRVLLGAILIADRVRAEAADAIRALRRLNIRTVLLTGDTLAVATAVGKTLQIDAVEAELLPDEKVAAVQRLAAGRHTVAMVGDGVNDAPALTHAAVGVAMGSGTDVARESANVVLLGNDLSKLVETMRIARRAQGIIRFNFVGTLAVDAVGVGLAALGLLNPLLAAFIHVASELTFILNSARLLPGTSRAPLQSHTRTAATAVDPAA
jgi:cation transport ATPase